MKPVEFVAKWAKIQQKETAVYVSHFEDLCRLVGHATPIDFDPGGERFSFQTTTTKAGGQKGFADVYFRDHFIWEYKGPHADLDKAYRQLQLYRESLDNPPLLITSDIRTIHIHSNFTNRPVVETVVTLDDIARGPGVEVLRRVFFDPDSFMPEKTRENITRATADTFLTVAEALRQHQQLTGEAYTPEQRAHFLIRLLFCLFAEDLGLLPDGLFTQLVKSQGTAYSDLRGPLKNLFAAMRGGGHFGMWAIRRFNGTLFDDEFVPTLPADLAGKVRRAAEQDWSAIDPSIFGTLFERIIDEDKRAQLGAHYTSKDDILLIVEPVLMEPLERKWNEVRRVTSDELRITSEERAPNSSLAHEKLVEFSNELAAIRVLDPACGSGNFLYVALRRLLDLQKEVIAFAARRGLPEIPLTVGPEQLYGIEINEYAHELAQVTAWIGYLQWRHENGFDDMADPVLRPLDNIRRMDAILAHDEVGNPVEPEWPAAEVIVGNPPFLGGGKLRGELGNRYTDDLFRLYGDRLPNFSDLVCYWFEKARAMTEIGTVKRSGLLATQAIRGGANRTVLDRIKRTGDIFWAQSDRNWVLDGATVHVSMV
ncbi:MAG TPA: class I SAM-dependent DNA methyltransferase, partial [Promineifilum sp.]|nr:class I SAM-dependent DNA methyltransferase [Promineifilum sp.]